MIDVALVSLLRAHAGVAKRIQPSTETIRVSPGDDPRIVYSLIDLQREYTDDGTTGVVEARYRFDIFAPKASEARTIADATRVGLDGYAGTIDTTKILRIWFDSESFQRGDRVEGANKTVARYVQDMFVLYREA